MKTVHVKSITRLGLLGAIILLQEFVPLLGNIPVGPFSLTLIGITVYVAALILGAKGGLLIGGFWGLITFIRAFTFPSSPVAPLVFTNPLISILPKLIMGGLCAWLYLVFHQHFRNSISMPLAIVLTEIVSTIATLGPIYLFFATPQVAHAFGATTTTAFGHVLMLVVLTNAIPETILTATIVPMIVLSLQKAGLAGDAFG